MNAVEAGEWFSALFKLLGEPVQLESVYVLDAGAGGYAGEALPEGVDGRCTWYASRATLQARTLAALLHETAHALARDPTDGNVHGVKFRLAVKRIASVLDMPEPEGGYADWPHAVPATARALLRVRAMGVAVSG